MKSITLLTDEQIISNASGEIKNSKDYNLRINRPYPGGLYDKSIFGTVDRCSCGKIRTPGKYCPRCKEYVYTDSEYANKYAYYRLKVPYVSFFKIPALQLKLNSMGINVTFKNIEDIWSTYFYIQELPDVSEIKGPEDWDDTEDYELMNEPGVILLQDNRRFKLIVKELVDPEVDDGLYEINTVGAFGLLKLREFTTEKGGNFLWIEQFVNSVLPITSPAHRPLTFYNMGQIKVNVPEITHYYRALITFNMSIDGFINSMYHKMVDRASLCCLMNAMVNRIMERNELLQPSKESLIRNLVETRVGRSGRATIVSRPDLPIDTVALPRSLVYMSLQSDIIDYLDMSESKNKFKSYANATPEALKALEHIVENSKTLLCRNPSLHKYSMMAFNIELWDEVVIGLPNLVCEAFNADFDGDQMWYVIVTDPAIAASLETMSPRNLWLYEKKNRSLYVPKLETLFGLHIATQIKSVDKMKVYNEFNEIEKEYDDGHISVDQQVMLGNKITTYGREKLNNIVGNDLEMILGNDGVTDKNIGKIISIIGAKPNRTQILLDLQNFGDKTSTLEGISTVPYKKIFKADPDKVREILSTDEPMNIKEENLKDYTESVIRETISNLPDTNIESILKGSNKVKISQIAEMHAPAIRTDGTIRYDSSTIFGGLNERSYTELAYYDRQTLQAKQDLTPVSGYDQRQLVDVEMHISYDKQSKSTDTQGIVLNAKDAVGRTKIDGSIVTDSDTGFVRVKSCVNTLDDKVCGDELSPQKFSSEQDGSAIGVSFASSLMEQVTQGALGLKHGGKLTSTEKEFVKALEPGKVTDISDKFITVKGNHVYRYVLTDVVTKDYKLKVGSYVITGQVLARSNKIVKVDTNLSKFNTLVDTNVTGDLGTKVNTSISYAPVSGIIRYEGDDVIIDGNHIGYSPSELYYYPDGYEVRIGYRISTGILDVASFNVLCGDKGWTYYCFYESIKNIFGDINSEIVETLFKSLLKSNFSVENGNKSNDNFINRMYYGSTVLGIKEAITRSVQESISNNDSKVDIKLKDTILLPLLGFRNESYNEIGNDYE